MLWPKRIPTIPISLMRYPAGLFQGWFIRIVILGVIAWQFLAWMWPTRPEMSPLSREAIDHQLSIAVNDLARKADELKVDRVVVLHLDHDDSGYATEALRRVLFNKGVGIQPAPTLVEKVRDRLNLNPVPYPDAGPAIAEGKSRNVDAVVFGSLLQAGTRVNLSLQLADVKTGKAQPIDSRDPAPPPSPGSSAAFSASELGNARSLLPGLKGILAWSAAALLLPLLAFSVLRDVTRQRSNRKNLFALVVFTIVDLLLLWIVLIGMPSTWLLAALLTGGVAVFFYNVSVMSWAVKLEE